MVLRIGHCPKTHDSQGCQVVDMHPNILQQYFSLTVSWQFHSVASPFLPQILGCYAHQSPDKTLQTPHLPPEGKVREESDIIDYSPTSKLSLVLINMLPWPTVYQPGSSFPSSLSFPFLGSE